VTEGHERGLVEGRQAGFSEGRQAGFDEGRTAGQAQARVETRQEAERELAAAVASALATAGNDAESAARQSAARALEAFRIVGRARSLMAVLDALLEAAEREGVRPRLLLVREGRATVWKSDEQVPPDVADLTIEAVQSATITSTAHHTALPVIVGGEVVAVLCIERPSYPSTFELLARFSSRCLEAITAAQTARLLTAPATDQSTERDLKPRDARDEEVAARRYARLLLSEIKLYHEADVIAGQRNRDLFARLGGEIARARALYEERMPQPLNAGYFREELVRTLADGDDTLLDASSLNSEV
jgi:hypothetical protein